MYTMHRFTDIGLSAPFKTLIPADCTGEPDAKFAAKIIHGATGEAMADVSSCMPYNPNDKRSFQEPRTAGFVMKTHFERFYLFAVNEQ